MVSSGELRVSAADRDRDLERQITQLLAERHCHSLRRLQVQARDGIVTLRGQVRSFYEKQLSHDCCRRVDGVVRMVDAVDVA
ncbi:MAG: BON domain-containing protein [Pirellulales bacterium]|nr:BON domain-containing protein [Pirellulales bacterium]